MNAASIADGRSDPPAPPPFVQEITITHTVNQMLGTSLTPAQIDEMPQDFIDRLMLLAKALGTKPRPKT